MEIWTFCPFTFNSFFASFKVRSVAIAVWPDGYIIIQSLAIYNNDNLPTCIIEDTKVWLILKTIRKFARLLKFYQSDKISSNLVTRVVRQQRMGSVPLNNIEHINGKALNSLNVLFCKCNDFDLSPKTFCQLFDAFVSPILNYSCEVWG